MQHQMNLKYLKYSPFQPETEEKALPLILTTILLFVLSAVVTFVLIGLIEWLSY